MDEPDISSVLPAFEEADVLESSLATVIDALLACPAARPTQAGTSESPRPGRARAMPKDRG